MLADGCGWGGASQGKGWFPWRTALPLMAWFALLMMYRLPRSPTPCVDHQPPSSRPCAAHRPFMDQVCDAQGVCEHRWLQPDSGRGRRLILLGLSHSRNAPVSRQLSIPHKNAPLTNELVPQWARAAPTPRRVTVLGLKGQGDVVNVEIDAHTQSIVRTVERYMLRLVGPPRT